MFYFAQIKEQSNTAYRSDNSRHIPMIQVVAQLLRTEL